LAKVAPERQHIIRPEGTSIDVRRLASGLHPEASCTGFRAAVEKHKYARPGGEGLVSGIYPVVTYSLVYLSCRVCGSELDGEEN
jgi:hypothetical protein